MKYFVFLVLSIFLIVSCISVFNKDNSSKSSSKDFIDSISSKLKSWESADRSSAKLAPLPKENKSAVVQVYAAALWGLRGLIADHTWISTKENEADSYTVYEVLGWRKAMGYDSVVRIEKDIPDRLWYGKKPRLLIDLRGKKAEKLINKIHKAAGKYPYKNKYVMLGPNSNTFTAWIACQVPELNLKLSKRAIGKSYLKTCS